MVSCSKRTTSSFSEAVADLGNIFQPPTTGARGPDLRCVVHVPPRALGLAEGYEVDVPLELEHEGQRVPRAVSSHDVGSRVRLYLPESLPEGALLRMRGLGGRQEGGAAGDLYVQIEVRAEVRWDLIGVGALAFVLGAAVAALFIDV